MRRLLLALATLAVLTTAPAASASHIEPDLPCYVGHVDKVDCGWIIDCSFAYLTPGPSETDAAVSADSADADADAISPCAHTIADCTVDIKLRTPPAQVQVVCQNDYGTPCELTVWYTSNPVVAEFECLLGHWPVTVTVTVDPNGPSVDVRVELARSALDLEEVDLGDLTGSLS